MKRNMKDWAAETISTPVKKAIPVLSFPAVQLMGVTVRDLISSSELQANGMKLVANKVPSGASVPSYLIPNCQKIDTLNFISV